ncbi:MAG: URC4/urg3 family protein [Proteobacteria bacterium]|nr:URC4/urg3 family protein [Pseudomonadota bacterium]
MNPDTAAALSLLSAEAVRARAHRLLAIGLADGLAHFRVDLARLDAAIDLTLATTRAAYPSLAVPFHSRWRHFTLDGLDRWAVIAAAATWKDKASRARAAFDLAIISVLLDAGAGPDWRYVDRASGARIGRSEGLALASLAMFSDGLFSTDTADPLRVDAAALQRLSPQVLLRGFQVAGDNPLVGIEGRCDLLRRLGATIVAAPAIFARDDTPRPGGFFDHIAARAMGGDIAAPAILSDLLRIFAPIWPSRITLGGVVLGDCWRHPALRTGDATHEMVPLHKLSQWLTYSLIEPMQDAGLRVIDIEGLTGLAEYRNGGLFIDTGVLALREPAQAQRAQAVSSTLVVEWRALTVALLDRLAAGLRARLGVDPVSFPLARVLEGGAWAAGRRIARDLRADGAPPISVVSDGTVF